MFVYSEIIKRSVYLPAMAVSAGLLLAGCGGDQPITKPKTGGYIEDSSAVFAPDAAQRGSIETDGSAADVAGGWSIVLLNAGGAREQAEQKLLIVQTDGGLRDAYIDKRPEGFVISYGHYLDRADPQAVKDLERVRGMHKDGSAMYLSAIMAPPTSDSLRGSNASYDLRRVKDRYGELAIYTLQIGIYGRSDYQAPNAEDLKAFRVAAENAVRDLRSQGVMAFYYHAPSRSMVTVGVFGERDFDATTRPPMESKVLSGLRKKFPNNLVNGQGVNETVRTESGKITRLQSSQLVGIPSK